MIPVCSWPTYEELLRALWRGGFSVGMQFEMSHPRVNAHEMIEFLEDIGLAQRVPDALTEAGEEYVKAAFVQNDQEAARAVLQRGLQRHPETIRLCQTLHGCPDLSAQNVRFLLEQGAEDTYDGQSVIPYLELLNRAGLVKFNRKAKVVTILWQPDSAEQPPKATFISPTTLYSNIKRLRKVLEALRGDVYWIDKHFDRKAFDPISDVADGNHWKRLTIMSGLEHATASARSDFARLRAELANKGIVAEWRVFRQDFLPKFHDRWLVADNTAYNVPPVNTIFKGQEAQILHTEDPPDVDQYVSNSDPIP